MGAQVSRHASYLGSAGAHSDSLSFAREEVDGPRAFHAYDALGSRLRLVALARRVVALPHLRKSALLAIWARRRRRARSFQRGDSRRACGSAGRHPFSFGGVSPRGVGRLARAFLIAQSMRTVPAALPVIITTTPNKYGTRRADVGNRSRK